MSTADWFGKICASLEISPIAVTTVSISTETRASACAASRSRPASVNAIVTVFVAPSWTTV
ncbi:hypothetical protein D3C75_1358300 [compost metagenome]